MRFIKCILFGVTIVFFTSCCISCVAPSKPEVKLYDFTEDEKNEIIKDLEDNCLDKTHCDDYLIKIKETERDGRVNVAFVCTGKDFLQEQNQIVTMNRTIARVNNFAKDKELYKKIHLYQFGFWWNRYDPDSCVGEYFSEPPEDFFEYQKDYKKYVTKMK